MIIIVDDKITFSTRRSTAHGYRHYNLSVEAMYHPYGFFIPEVKTGNEVLDIFAGDVFDSRSVSELFAGILITASGKLYWVARSGEHYARRRHIWGPGTVEVFHDSGDLSQVVGMALRLNDNDVQKAIELTGKVINGIYDSYITMSIPAILEELERRDYTSEPKALRPWFPAMANESLA